MSLSIAPLAINIIADGREWLTMGSRKITWGFTRANAYEN